MIGHRRSASCASPREAVRSTFASCSVAACAVASAQVVDPPVSDAESAGATGFGESKIRVADLERLEDFAFLTPNLTLIDTQSLGHAFAVVRGIGQLRRTDPSIAVIVDGVPMTHAAQLNQTLLGATRVEVIRGPADQLRGRGALGGTVLVTTQPAAENFRAEIAGGSIHSGGFEARLGAGAPIGHGGGLSYYGTVGHESSRGRIDNPYLGERVDPYRDTAGRFRLAWAPTTNVRTEARLYGSRSTANAHYFTVADNPNDIVPVRVNNSGFNELEQARLSFAVDWETALGTLSSITSADDLEEVAAGDGFDYRPIEESFFHGVTGLFDLAQSQYLHVRARSQQFLFSSNRGRPVSWTVGAYYVSTKQFLSSGDHVDIGAGVFPGYGEPGSNPASPQISFLADAQDAEAWSLFGGIDIDLGQNLGLSLSARHVSDLRIQTTMTPQEFLDGTVGGEHGFTGNVRDARWDSWQPTAAVRYKPADGLILRGSYSRGFRAGGFNQAGVAAVARDAGVTPGIVVDEFDAETADTLEASLATGQRDGRISSAVTLFATRSKNAQYFYFLAENTSQNVANLEHVRHRGIEVAVEVAFLPRLDLSLGYALTDSEIKAAKDESQVGNHPPLALRSTANIGIQYRRILGRPLDRAGSGLQLLLRADYRRIGETYWSATADPARDPINLVNLHVGIGGPTWSMLLHATNAADTVYNAEFSPLPNGGGLAFRASRCVWGLKLRKSF